MEAELVTIREVLSNAENLKSVSYTHLHDGQFNPAHAEYVRITEADV